MGAVGIVAEYDPFHLGHRYHIRETKRQTGGDPPVVCVMSGSWGQRGTCTLADKWTRAELALRGGADLVLELPAWRSLSSAEGFARGAVSLLAASGVVDTLSFGSECGQLEPLEALAECLDGPDYRNRLRLLLRGGASFAQCRQRAAGEIAGENLAGLLAWPNNNLGVEYLRTIRAWKGNIRPVTVSRKGAAHNCPRQEDGFFSASRLRALARAGDWRAVEAGTPPGTAEALRLAGISDMRHGERAVLARLRSMSEEDFAALPDAGAAEGFPARLFRAARRAGSLEEFDSLAGTRRIPRARVRRLTARAFLGLTAETVPEQDAFLRVLGMNPRGMELLKEMKRRSSLPVLTKTAHVRRLGGEAERQFELECRATGLYGLFFETARPCGLDYTKGPVILQTVSRAG